MHPMAQRLIDEYLEDAGHRDDQKRSLFRPVKNNITGSLLKPLDPHAVYSCIIPQLRKRNRHFRQHERFLRTLDPLLNEGVYVCKCAFSEVSIFTSFPTEV